MSDATWKIHASPILASDFMLGESYDARQEIAGWDQPGLDDAAWPAATVRHEPPGRWKARSCSRCAQTGELKPKSVAEPKPGRWTFDLGQNMVGVVRLKVSAPAGTKLTLRHAEMLNPDGTLLHHEPPRRPVGRYLRLQGRRREVWQPTFTFHGFRYVELTGLLRQGRSAGRA